MHVFHFKGLYIQQYTHGIVKIYLFVFSKGILNPQLIKTNVSVRIVTSQRGNPVVMVSGYRFKRTSAYGPKSWWHCIKRSSVGCTASVRLHYNKIERYVPQHNHWMKRKVDRYIFPVITVINIIQFKNELFREVLKDEVWNYRSEILVFESK